MSKSAGEFETATQDLQDRIKAHLPESSEEITEKSRETLVNTVKEWDEKTETKFITKTKAVEAATRRVLASWYPLPSNNYESSEAKENGKAKAPTRQGSRGRKKQGNKTVEASRPAGLVLTELLLDVAISCTQQNLAEPQLPFMLLEDALQMSRITTCSILWGYLEERRDTLTSSFYLPPRTSSNNAKLALLRTSIDLLRRLSQERETEFSGRVLMFLVYGLPISERSGVNASGVFNQDVANAYQQDEQQTSLKKEKENAKEDQDTEMADGEREAPQDISDRTVDQQLYQAFWDLQFVLAYPLKAVKSLEEWSSFVEKVNLIIGAFESQAAETTQDDNFEMFHSVKYLTSPKLFNIQLTDTTIRRVVLFQILIAIRFLYDPRIKQRPAEFPSGANVLDNLKEIEGRVISALKSTSPDGKVFTEAILLLLEREKFWTEWKANGCESFETQIDKGEYSKFAPSVLVESKAKTENDQELLGLPEKRESNPKDWACNCVLADDLYDKCGEFIEDNVPSLKKFVSTIKTLSDPNDPFLTTAEQVKELASLRKNKSFIWKGTRALAEHNLSALEKMPQKNFVDVVADLYEITLPKPEESTAASEAATAAGDSPVNVTSSSVGTESATATATATAASTSQNDSSSEAQKAEGDEQKGENEVTEETETVGNKRTREETSAGDEETEHRTKQQRRTENGN